MDELRTVTPSMTDEALEAKNIVLAQMQAQEMLEKKRATSQLVLHYLEKGSEKGNAQLKKLQLENELLKKRIAEQGQDVEMQQIFEDAMVALKTYQVTPQDEH
jgi:hypothetical protein